MHIGAATRRWGGLSNAFLAPAAELVVPRGIEWHSSEPVHKVHSRDTRALWAGTAQ